VKKINTNNIMLIISLLLFFISCNNHGREKIINSHKDKENSPELLPSNNKANQEWSSTNLNISTFKNGDVISEAKTDKEWRIAGKEGNPVWCYTHNDRSNGDKYGKLYNWYAVNDPRGLAPSGWHIPSDEEWSIFIDNCGGEYTAGTAMKSEVGWQQGGNGNNKSRFTGLPGGVRDEDGKFYGFGYGGSWWSSTQSNIDNAWDRSLHYDSGDGIKSYCSKNCGLSVRCVKD
jgi:uncharacterized protein (TIGR02145 family)